MNEGLILGLSNTFGCLGTCAPVLLPYFLSNAEKPLIPILKFLFGRLLAYSFFAILAGYTSVYFEGRINPDILYSATIVLSLWLIFYSMGKLKLHLPLCRVLGNKFKGNNFPLFAGFVLGLNLCPPFFIGLNEVLSYGSILKSLIFFGGFYLGSSLWVFIFMFSGKIQNMEKIRLLGSFAGISVGLYFLFKGITGFY